jgi:hypothetical protein
METRGGKNLPELRADFQNFCLRRTRGGGVATNGGSARRFSEGSVRVDSRIRRTANTRMNLVFSELKPLALRNGVERETPWDPCQLSLEALRKPVQFFPEGTFREEERGDLTEKRELSVPQTTRSTLIQTHGNKLLGEEPEMGDVHALDMCFQVWHYEVSVRGARDITSGLREVLVVMLTKYQNHSRPEKGTTGTDNGAGSGGKVDLFTVVLTFWGDALGPASRGMPWRKQLTENDQNVFCGVVGVVLNLSWLIGGEDSLDSLFD